jgi:hypothetical protein
MRTRWDYWAIRVLPFFVPIALGFFFYFLVDNSANLAIWIDNNTNLAIWSVIAVGVIVGLVIAAFIHQKLFSEIETSGLLYTASEPTPPTPCPNIPKEALIFLLGSSASYTTALNHTVLRVAGENLLSIKRKNEGMAVSAKIYSSDRKIVAEIIDNNFRINPSNCFRRERPDQHTLAIFDQQGARVLFIRHLNFSAIKILGTFHSAKGIVRISEEEVFVPGRDRLSRFCFGNGVVSIQIN